MSVRIRNGDKEYMSTLNVQADTIFDVETEQTMSVEMREYVIDNLKGKFTVLLIFIGWLIFMSTLGIFGGVYNIIEALNKTDYESVIEQIIEPATYIFMLILFIVLEIVFVKLFIKIKQINRPAYEDTHFLWRKSHVSEDYAYYYRHNRNRTIDIDNEFIPPLTGLDYEAAGPGKEFIVVYFLNKSQTSVSRTYAFSTDFSNHHKIITGITSQDINDNTESGAYIDSLEHDYIAKCVHRKCMYTIVTSIIYLLSLFAVFKALHLTLETVLGENAVLIIKSLSETDMETSFVIGFLILFFSIIIFTNILRIIKAIIIACMISNRKYNFEKGRITNRQVKSSKNAHMRYMWVNNIRCLPLSKNDFINSNDGDAATIIYIKIPMCRLIKYAMKDDNKEMTHNENNNMLL